MSKLIAPVGTDESAWPGTMRVANIFYSDTSYRVRDDGTVTVPDYVAKDLVHCAGFSLAGDPIE
jgi:hypothetical protein